MKSAPANVLLIMADRMTPFMLEACGGVGARTRNLTELARTSANFTNAYTPSPICVPAIDTPVSLLDVPTTLIDIAGQTPVQPLEGRSLLAAANGAELEDIPVISEYHGEGIMRPSFMVRLADWKYFYCRGSDPQLFNLTDDPGEWRNRAGDPDCSDIETRLNKVITGGSFDLERIRSEVWNRLPMKTVVNAAMKANATSWDYVVDQNAAAQYVRE